MNELEKTVNQHIDTNISKLSPLKKELLTKKMRKQQRKAMRGIANTEIQTWDHVQESISITAKAINEANELIYSAAGFIRYNSEKYDLTELGNKVTHLIRDIADFNISFNDLKMIAKPRGTVVELEDTMANFMCYEKSMSLYDDFNNTILPIILDIASILNDLYSSTINKKTETTTEETPNA